ncbi:hypothetical protein, partial [Pseudomonas vancouverensis]|uniref:hypothetical protein n=1 Tax=Pseudomonas vancouverensis TaxID=95300 RepID=UPI001BAF6793
MRGGLGARREFVLDLLAAEVLVGDQSRRWVALAMAQVAIQRSVTVLEQIHQARAIANNGPGAVALWAIDLIAFA